MASLPYQKTLFQSFNIHGRVRLAAPELRQRPLLRSASSARPRQSACGRDPVTLGFKSVEFATIQGADVKTGPRTAIKPPKSKALLCFFIIYVRLLLSLCYYTNLSWLPRNSDSLLFVHIHVLTYVILVQFVLFFSYIRV